MPDEENADWKFLWLHDQAEPENVVFGLWWREFCLIGIVAKGNYPPDDPIWPDRCGECGLNIAGHFIGWRNDPGY